MPFVSMPSGAFSNIQGEWQIPEYRTWYERLAEKRTLVRFDPRGAGLSGPDVGGHPGRFLSDVEAVVDRLGFERFALLGLQHSGPIGIAYAAMRPERVSHLILWCTWARGSDIAPPQLRGLRRLMDTNWELYAETVAHVLLGWSEGEKAHKLADLARDTVTQEQVRALLQATLESDVTTMLAHVKAPTLVLHRRKAPFPEVTVARDLASRISEARLALLEGTSLAPWLGDTEAVLQAIDEFLGDGEEPAEAAELPEGMAVILFADIVESTALTEQLGDAAFRAKARELDTALRAIIRECSGTPVEGKVLGDGVLAVFTSARQAIECALRCNAAGDSVELQLHLGIHAGDVIREGNNVYGGAVNIAARIAGATAPGEVLVSDTVRSLARTSAGVAFDDRGEQSLKGVADPQRLFAVRGDGA